MIVYDARLDVPRELALYVARLLRVERRERGTRRGRRVLGAFGHAVLMLRWFRDATPIARLARDAGIGISTAYRYLHEGIDVLAAQAPDLPDVLRERLAVRESCVILDGMLVPADRVAERTAAGSHRWYSGKHHAFGGNVQFVSSATGFPLWMSDVEPGSTHDLTAARRQGAIGALCSAAPKGLPTLADKAFQAAGIGIHTPIKNPPGDQVLDVDNRARNMLLTRLRCLGERAAAMLTTRWRALARITLCPWRIGSITQAALVLTQFEHQGRY